MGAPPPMPGRCGWRRAPRRGLLAAMHQPPPTGPAASPEPQPPLGSWPRTYAATIGLAVLVIALLWLLTAFGNVPLGIVR